MYIYFPLNGFIDTDTQKKRVIERRSIVDYFRWAMPKLFKHENKKKTNETRCNNEKRRIKSWKENRFFRYTVNSININTLMDTRHIRKSTLHEFNIQLSGKNSLIWVINIQCMLDRKITSCFWTKNIILAMGCI